MKSAKHIYVCLLRGINVGGKNKVDMKQLKKTFERVGLRSVQTYINSGNIVFIDETNSVPELKSLLQDAILEDFQLSLELVLRNLTQMRKLIKALPEAWRNDQAQKSDVMFLWDEVNHASVLKQLTVKDYDTVEFVSGAILWNVRREYVTRSGMQKLPGTALYKQMTIRNVNTTCKVFAMMDAAAKQKDK